jgi:hypothetical protein
LYPILRRSAGETKKDNKKNDGSREDKALHRSLLPPGRSRALKIFSFIRPSEDQCQAHADMNSGFPEAAA